MMHRAKKSLGQNFLKSNLALKKIIEAGEISPDDIILEIGPGKGALTEKLLAEAGTVIAVEKDRNLFEFLHEKFSKEISSNPPSHKAPDGRGKLILINEDILKFEITEKIFSDSPRKFSAENFLCPSPSLLPRVRSRTFSPPLKYKVVANIPYNITGAILKKFLTGKSQPSLMVLMVQHEVAKRIIGRDGESLLSISVKSYGEPKMIMKVPARYFSPSPKVDSAVIAIKNISRKVFIENNIDEKKFWEIVHAGFAHKRKKLSNNLKKILKNIPEEWKNKRAEELSLENWISLAKI